MTHTTQSLTALSLKEIAHLVGVPSILKMSKEKAVARALKELAAQAPAKPAKAAKAKAEQAARDAAAAHHFGKPAKAAKAKAAKPVVAHSDAKVTLARPMSKHARLYDALTHTAANREYLMEVSGFDEKNLSVAMSNLRRAGFAIVCEIKDGERIYYI